MPLKRWRLFYEGEFPTKTLHKTPLNTHKYSCTKQSLKGERKNDTVRQTTMTVAARAPSIAVCSNTTEAFREEKRARP
jgi:hypothetical protein